MHATGCKRVPHTVYSLQSDECSKQGGIRVRMKFPQNLIAATAGAVICICTSSMVMADDWFRWRGPSLNGISAETGWIDTWPKDGPPIAWKAHVGTGFSSVSVADGRLYTMGNQDEEDTVYCLDATTGKQLWKHSYPSPLDAEYFDGGPTSTPTVDGGHVYTLSRRGDLFCFDVATGHIEWNKNVAQEKDIRLPGWGFASSPLVHGNILLLNVGAAGMAVDKTTGKIVWASEDRDAGYTTPVPFLRDGRWCAIIASGRFYLAVDIETGQQLWRHRWVTRFGCNAADPILAGEHVFVSSGYNQGSALLKIDGKEPSVVWAHKKMQNQCNSSILIDGYLYGIDGNSHTSGSLKCVELSSGKVRWSDESPGFGSLTAADGRLIVLGEEGQLMVARASPDGFEPSARASVLEGRCWTVPVLANGRIYCRNAAGDLVCVDVRDL